MFTIRTFPFDANGQSSSTIAEGGSNWPVVYLISNKTDLFIGETTDFEQQFLEHLKNKKKDKTCFTEIRFAYDGTENQSAVKEYESSLIRLYAADGRFQHVLNSYPRQNQSHNFHQRILYSTKVQTLWNQLYSLNLTKHNYQSLINDSLYKFSPYTSLTAEQMRVAKEILEDFIDSLSLNKKGGAIVSGGAGTGKTILAVKIIDMLLNVSQYLADWKRLPGTFDKGWCSLLFKLKSYIATNGPLKIAYVAPQQSFNADMRKAFGKMPWQNGQDIVHNTSSIVTKYKKLEPFDIVLVDETHRLKHRCGMGNDIGLFDENRRRLGLPFEATQLDVIFARSKYCCLFYDSYQSIKNSDITPYELERSLLTLEHSPLRKSISVQKRCLGGGDYEKFIDDVLSGKSSQQPFDNYDFRVYDDVSLMVNDIRNLDKTYGLCRNLAGFSWPWRTKKFLKENKKTLAVMGGPNRGKNATNLLKMNQFDISIGQNRFVWNTKSTGWITSLEARNEIGCIHTSQGYDLNYCGVILGPDIRYNTTSKKIEIDPSRFCDPFLKQHAKSISSEDTCKYIINAYRTMLFRGIYGCYVYAVDDNLRHYLKQCEASVKYGKNKYFEHEAPESYEKTLDQLIINKTNISNNSHQNYTKWFGQLVVSLRNKQGITQEELAFRANISRSYMGVIERGEKSPSMETISKVAKGLGMSIQDLFNLDK